MAFRGVIRAGWIVRVSGIVVVQVPQQCRHRVTLNNSRIEIIEMAAGS